MFPDCFSASYDYDLNRVGNSIFAKNFLSYLKNNWLSESVRDDTVSEDESNVDNEWIFQIREESPYNLRYAPQFTIPSIHSVYNGRESVSFMVPKMWKLIPPAFKQIKSLLGFKKAIKEWKPSNCPCWLCKTYHKLVFYRIQFWKG